MKRMFFLFSLVLALTIASTTYVLAAGPPVSPGAPIQILKGDFSKTLTTSCVQGDFGTGPQFQLLTPGNTTVTTSGGTLKLFGDGTGYHGAEYLMIRNDAVGANQYPLLGFLMECDVTYQATPEGAIEFRHKNCEGIFRAGGVVPGTLMGIYTEIVEYARLSTDGITLVFRGDMGPPSVETTWIKTGNVTTTYDSICIRSGTAIKIR